MKSYKKGLLALLTLFLSVSISTVGFSSFVINNQLNTTSTIQINKTNKDEKVKISFKYQVCTGYKEEIDKGEEVVKQKTKIENETNYNDFFTYVNSICINDFSKTVKDGTYHFKGINEFSGWEINIYVTKKIYSYWLFGTKYSGEYNITKSKITINKTFVTPDTSTSITIDKGSSIPTSFIKNSFYKDSNSKDYEFVVLSSDMKTIRFLHITR